MTLLPFTVRDDVRYRDMRGVVIEVAGDRVIVRTEDGLIRITTDVVLRSMQPAVERYPLVSDTGDCA